MKSKSFKYWKVQELHDTFGVRRLFEMPLFDEWASTKEHISAEEAARLESLRIKAVKNIDYWNEEELKMNFIGAVLDLANLNGENYRTFYDRPVSVIIGEMRLFGKLDGAVASGFQEPKTPFFCLHEYKQENNREGDPKGQLLAAMIAAQALNQNNRPVYGCTVLARNWYFMILEEKNYYVSDVFVSTHSDDLQQIFKMLRYIKAWIERF